MALNDIYRVDFRMLQDDRTVSTSVHYQEIDPASGTPFEVATQLAAAAEISFWTTFWRPNVSPDVSYVNTRAQQVWPARDRPGESQALAAQAGSSVGSPMNGTTACIFATYGIIWAKNFQGRVFLPGITEADVFDGRIQTATYTTINTDGQTFFNSSEVLSAPAGGEYAVTAFSPALAKAGAPAPYSLMSNSVLRPRIGTQKRRRTNIATPS